MSDAGSVGGRCACSGVRFEVRLPTRFCAHCHCDNCRRAHGAAFVTWIGVPDEQLAIVNGGERLVRFETDTGATRTFCGRCGSTLFYAGPRWPGETHVALAHMEGPVDRRPAAHVFVDDRAPWHEIGDDLPQFGGTSGTTPAGG